MTAKKWNKETLAAEIKNLPFVDLTPKILKKKYSYIYHSCRKVFGSLKKAYEYSGIDYENTLSFVNWTKDKILNVIDFHYKNNIPLTLKFLDEHGKSGFRKSANNLFGSWKNAIESAGIDYEEVRSKDGWGKPYKSKDGVIYCSHTEGFVADRLFELKEEQIILDYKSQVPVISVKNWSCDFKILFPSGFELFLEVDGLGKSRNHGNSSYSNNHPKIKFYNQYKYPYAIIKSFKELDEVIDKFSDIYYIPIKNTLISCHLNPDGDGISSCVSIYNYIKSNGKSAYIKLCGVIPSNLKWMLENLDKHELIINEDTNDYSKIDQIVILDSSCLKERLGWVLPSNIPVINIDHHKSRLSEHSPENNVYVIDSCSNAIVLFRWFNIKDNILSVGAYTDTYFSKNIKEVMYFLLDLNISEEEIEEILDKVSFRSDRKTWHIIRDSKKYNCSNGFIIIETFEDDISSIENALSILMKMGESICLIYGDKQVKLRTSNKDLDVSIIAKKFGGGGHEFAAMCNVKNHLSEFKDFIKHYERE